MVKEIEFIKYYHFIMFVQTPIDKLVVGMKYKIELGDDIFIGYYKETKQCILFVNGPKLYYVYPFRTIYQYVSENPYWKMERRAVNLIVKQILGDDCFEW